MKIENWITNYSNYIIYIYILTGDGMLRRPFVAGKMDGDDEADDAEAHVDDPHDVDEPDDDDDDLAAEPPHVVCTHPLLPPAPLALNAAMLDELKSN